MPVSINPTSQLSALTALCYIVEPATTHTSLQLSTMASPGEPCNSTNSHEEPVDTAAPVIVEPKGSDTSPATDTAPSAVEDSPATGPGGGAAASSKPAEELGKVTLS